MELSLSKSKDAFLSLSKTTTEYRNELLNQIRLALIKHRSKIEEANAADIQDSKQLVAGGELSQTLVDRLGLYGSKFDGLMGMVDSVSKLADPLGIVSYSHDMLVGGELSVHRVSCPIGVIGVIFESRPEAAVQIASLCVKSGNSVVLKGGKEAHRTVRALVHVMRSVVGESVQLVESREEISLLLKMDRYVDLVIPRGGADLVKYCKANTTIPVMGHADGICAVYVDSEADIAMAINIIVDAKTQYPAVCNAAETLLVHVALKDRILQLLQPLLDLGVQIRATPEVMEESKLCVLAKDSDFRTEFCDLILAVKFVPSAQAAIDHINTHGSHHTDAIVTSNPQTAELFLQAVDSADVVWNASTRFADGNRLGFGAEVGISTNKIHARGPVGLEGLTTYKYRIYGSGQTVGKDGPHLVALAAPNPHLVRTDSLHARFHGKN